MSMAMTTIDLLADGASEARRVKVAFTPRFSKDGYLDFARKLAYQHEFTER